MKIVHVVRQFHPAVGGLESVVLELVKWQVAHGHEVRVVTLNRIFNAPDHNRLPSRATIAGAKVIRIPFFGSPRYPIAPSVIRHLAGADVVHIHAIDFFFDYLAWTKPLHGRRLIASTHGGYFHTSYAGWLKRFFFATVTRASMTWYGAIAAVSRSDYERFRTRRRNGIVCIENGVDVGRFAQAASPMPAKCIVTVGRFSTNKRLDRLVFFMQALHRRDPAWRLKILGRPWDFDVGACKALIEHCGIGEAVEITALPTDADIRTAMGSASIAASASEYEGFGIFAVEALSAGLFPLLNDIAPFRDVVERAGVGLLVDFADPQAAAERLLASWIGIESNYAALRRLAMAAAEKFEWSHAAEAYMRLYDSVTGSTVRTILDVCVKVETPAGAVDLLDSLFRELRSSVVAFANAHVLNVAAGNERFRQLLHRCVVFNDGIGTDIASRVLYGTPFPSNLNGTDFVPRYLRETQHRFRIFLLGSETDVVERAAARLLQLHPQHHIVGLHSGYFPMDRGDRVAARVRATGADVILVGMGNPRQELWLDEHLSATGCRLGFAVGALFDFLAGTVPRAAPWMRRARLEWVHRLLCEPRRLARRYLLGNPAFLLRVVGQWGSGARIPG
jgi:alpha-1,3-mannosyltransferase